MRSPAIATVGLGAAVGEHTGQMEACFPSTAHSILKDSPRAARELSAFQAKHLAALAGVCGLFTVMVTRLLLNFRLPVFLLEEGQELLVCFTSY